MGLVSHPKMMLPHTLVILSLINIVHFSSIRNKMAYFGGHREGKEHKDNAIYLIENGTCVSSKIVHQVYVQEGVDALNGSSV